MNGAVPPFIATDPGFARYHHVLSRARWDSRAVAGRLLAMIVDTFLPDGPIVIGIDDTIERRWGAKITARGIYRDPVRSSHGHFVKASGLRWLSLMVMVPVAGARRRWALPFLTVLAPSERSRLGRGRRHKKLTDWARQALLQTKRWLPHRRIIAVADASFAALDLIAAPELVEGPAPCLPHYPVDERGWGPVHRRQPVRAGTAATARTPRPAS